LADLIEEVFVSGRTTRPFWVARRPRPRSISGSTTLRAASTMKASLPGSSVRASTTTTPSRAMATTSTGSKAPCKMSWRPGQPRRHRECSDSPGACEPCRGDRPRGKGDIL